MERAFFQSMHLLQLAKMKIALPLLQLFRLQPNQLRGIIWAVGEEYFVRCEFVKTMGIELLHQLRESRFVAELDEDLASRAMNALLGHARSSTWTPATRRSGSTVPCAMWPSSQLRGITSTGVWGVSEAKQHWLEFHVGLVARGLRDIRLIVSDNHSGRGHVTTLRGPLHLQHHATGSRASVCVTASARRRVPYGTARIWPLRP